MNTIEVNVDYSKPQKLFHHFYNAVGYANADFTYTEPTKRMYDHLSSFHNHYQYMRMHNILTAHGKGDYFLLEHGQDYGNPLVDIPGSQLSKGGDSVVSRDKQGELSFNWTVVDQIYDILLEHGICPIVETVFMPSCLQKSGEFWHIPGDFKEWRKVIQEFTKHLQERYGKAEIEKWYFEVWNEPDGVKEWDNNPGTFLALYDYMEDAVHSINPKIRVGGPAVKQGDQAKKLFGIFLDHCSKGLNYATGKFGTRVDFLSVHCKGGWPDGYNPSTEVMFGDLRVFMELLKEYPEYKGIEFFNDESDIVWKGYRGTAHESWLNFRNTHYPPGFICKMINTYCDVAEDEFGVNLSIVDSDNCHVQWEKDLFGGYRSQLTPLIQYPSTDMLKKPIFNAYVLMSRLQDKRLSVECDAEGFRRKFGVLPTCSENTAAVMVWNFEDGVEDGNNARKLSVALKNLPFKGKYKLMHYRIDSVHSSSYNAWKQMGKPEKPTAEQIGIIRESEGLELYSQVKDVEIREDLTFELEMPMHSVSLLLLVPENKERPEKIEWVKGLAEKGFNGNTQVFLKWKPNSERDFLYYRIFRKSEAEKEFQLLSDNTTLNTATYTDMNVNGDNSYVYKLQSVNASMVYGNFSEEFIVKT